MRAGMSVPLLAALSCQPTEANNAPVLVTVSPQGTASSSSAPGCAAVGCMDALIINLAPMSEPGSYVIDVAAGDESATCKINVPVRCGVGRDCDGSLRVLWFWPGCEGRVVEESVDLQLPSVPDTLDIQMTFNGTSVLKQSLRPDYRRVEAAGAGCEPVCKQAKVQIVTKQ